ncbi:MAG TPA: hypothetical protein VG870_10980 [Chitinophagaceae bacterium]|nr:hypothetical protein [Chitinophagaceae bacterium]
MAEILFDKFADRQALQAEKDYVLGLFDQIKAGIKDLSTVGEKINVGTSVRSINASYQEYDRIVKTVSQRVAELNGHSKELTQQILIEARAAKELSAAKLNEEKASLAAAKAKESEARAARILNDEQDRANKINASGDYAAQVLANSKAFQAEADAKTASMEAGDAYAKSLEYQRQQQEELNAAMQSAAQSGNQPAKLVGDASETKAATEAVIQYASASEQITGTLEQNQKLQATYQAELKGTADQIKFLEVNTTDAEKSTQRYQDKIAGLKQQQGAIKTELANVNKITALQTVANNAQSGSLEQLRAKLQLATIAYTQLSETERKSLQGQAIHAEVVNLSNEVSTLEQGIGQFQRNVGNYGSAVTKFFGDAWTAVRKVAYILPGVGIAGIFSAVGEAVISAIQSLNLFDSVSSRVQKALKQVTADSNDEIGKEVGELQALYRVSQDNTQSIEQRRAATQKIVEINDENNKKTGETNKLVIDQNGILAQNDEAINKISESLIKQAKTKAYLGVLEKAYTDLINKQSESLKSQTSYLQDAAILTNKALTTFFTFGQVQAPGRSQIQQGLKDKGIKDAQAYLDALQKQFQSGLKDGDLTLDGILSQTSKTGQKSKALQDLQKFLDEANKAQFDSYKIAQQQKIENDKIIADDDKKSHEERFQALLQFLNDSKDLADAQAQFDIDAARKTAQQRIKEAGGNKEAIKAIELAKNSEIERIEADHQAKLQDIIINANKIKLDIMKNDGSEQLQLMERITKQFDAALKDTLDKSNKSFDDDIQKRLAKTDKIKELASELTNFAFTAIDAQYENQKNALQEQIDLIDERTQKEIDSINATTLSEQDKAAKIAILQARAQAQKDQLQKEQREADQKKAVADKAKAVADIIENTAVGVSKALATEQFWMIPFIVGIGAAQLATVVAQPIPQYRTGTKSAKPGLAMVSEEGREMIIDRQGRVSLTPDTPSLIQLSGGETIIPHDPTEQMIARSHLVRDNILAKGVLPGMSRQWLDAQARSEAKLEQIRRAITQIPTPAITIVENQNWNSYIKRNTQS